jgi:hypothetical protein
MRIVCQHHSGREEDVIFDRGELADVAIAMDADAIAKHAIVINGGAVPYGAIVADAITFTDNYIVAGLEAVANLDGRVNHASGADLRAIADAHRFTLDCATRWIAQNHAGIDRTIRA